MKGPSIPPLILYLCVFLSGFAALVYEVVWARQLTLVLGITTYAHTAVLTAFMAGLALGSVVLGRVSDRLGSPLRFYAWLEVGIGGYAALTPWLLPALERFNQLLDPAQAGSTLATYGPRFALSFLALMVPTFLMGGTLPAVVRGLSSTGRRLPSTLAAIYGVNTVGAAVGALAAGYLLLPTVGVRATLLSAVGLNMLVAAVVLQVTAGERTPSPSIRDGTGCDPTPTPGHRIDAPFATIAPEALTGTPRTLLLLGFALSGFGALAAQLAWARALTLVIGSSVYALAATLTTFLVGLGAGSLLWAGVLRIRARAGRTSFSGAMALAAILETLLAIGILCSLPMLHQLPELFILAYDRGWQESFVRFQGFTFVLAAMVMALPTLLLGALFPLITAILTPERDRIGRQVGSAFAVNSLGTIAGSLTAGLVLLPSLGTYRTLIAIAGLHTLVAVLFFGLRPGPRTPRRWLAPSGAVAVFLLIAVNLPPWDRVLMTSGPFINAFRYADLIGDDDFREWLGKRNVQLFYREGVHGTVTVRDIGGERALVINGKTDASSRGDLATQILLAQLPLLTHPAPRDVAMIGLGSGISAGSVATHSGVRSLDVVEISPEVVAASDLFRADNGNVLDDPRVRVWETDARSFFLARDATYDVIVAEPSNPWISGVSSLFTREFFSLARRRLRPGGVMAQWCHTYGMSAEDLRSILFTFQQVFPEVSVWLPQLGDLVFLGSLEPHTLDYPRLAEALDIQSIGTELARIDKDSPWALVRTLLLDPQEVSWYAAGARANTDDMPHVEFGAPQNIYRETTLDNVLDIVRHLDGRPTPVPITRLAVDASASLSARSFGVDILPGQKSEAPTALDARWLVTWHAFEAADPEALNRVGVTSRRVMDWREGEDRLRLSASRVPETPDLGQLQDDLLSERPGRFLRLAPLSSGGGQTPGVWAGGGGDSGSLVGVAWICPPGPADVQRYLATIEVGRMIDSADWATEAERLRRRFVCLDPTDVAHPEVVAEATSDNRQ